MTYVRTFDGFAPPPRNDGVPFSMVKIFEGITSSYAAATNIDTIAISPLDTDPTRPQKRSFTTALAAIMDKGYYWLVWEDANGAQFIADPIQFGSTMMTEIANLVRSEMTLTWDALAKDENIGVAVLLQRIANTKANLLPGNIAIQDEASYSSVLKSYIAKSAALDLIPAGIDYWMRQKISISATGTNETVSYTDPVGALRELARTLTRQVAALKGNPEVISSLIFPGELPAISGDAEDVLITSDPYDYLPAFNNETL